MTSMGRVAMTLAARTTSHWPSPPCPNWSRMTLYYFHPDQPEESMNRLLRAGIVVCLVLRWGVRQDDQQIPVVLGPALEATVRRVVNDYDTNYVGGRSTGGDQPAPLEPAEAAVRLDRLRAEVDEAGPGLRATGQEVPKEFASFLAWADARLARLAQEHGFEDQALLGASCRRLT